MAAVYEEYGGDDTAVPAGMLDEVVSFSEKYSRKQSGCIMGMGVLGVG